MVLYLQNSIAPPGGQKSHRFAIKKSDQKQKSFIYSTFFKFLIHLFHNSLIFANSLLDDPAPNLLSGGLKINFSGIENSYFSYFCRLV